jgi:16S rRNA (cytosine967-C5)-methyltransferase
VKDGGRLSAAIEILTEIEVRRRPVKLTLQDWGKAHRFAGSSDRAWISGLVLDVLRARRSLAWRMDNETPRAAALAALRFAWDWPGERIAEAASETPHGPGALTADEQDRLEQPRDLAAAPPPVRGDYPDWLDPHFERVFGEARADELAAMTARAPIDLRVNTLKATATQVTEALEALAPRLVGPATLRLDPPAADMRPAPIDAHPAFARGWFEVQDAGSQRAAAAAGELRGPVVLDLCAGGGGKTLALGAAMENSGRLIAYDADPRRMRDLIPRAERAGLTNLDVRSPMDSAPLADLAGAVDVVFVDAPCTGSGAWRRHPDTKWKLKPPQLERRMAEQDAVLDQAAGLTRPGGRIVYVTCSLLAEENEDRIAAFTGRHPAFVRIGPALRTTPLRDQTDGFFAAVLERAKDSG